MENVQHSICNLNYVIQLKPHSKYTSSQLEIPSVSAVKENNHCLYYVSHKPSKYVAPWENTESMNVTRSGVHSNCCSMNG